MENQLNIVAKNQRKQYEMKQNTVKENSVKQSDHITKQGRSFEVTLSTVSNIGSYTDTMNKSTDSILQGIL